ncbi:MAG: hypothetical protein LBT40_15495, partial [Deltaproteobacteria bacterium]|nr:hypothetical protein [Deltaproteobacteria bacterium]
MTKKSSPKGAPARSPLRKAPPGNRLPETGPAPSAPSAGSRQCLPEGHADVVPDHHKNDAPEDISTTWSPGPALDGCREAEDVEGPGSSADGPRPATYGSREPEDGECRGSSAEGPGPVEDGSPVPADVEGRNSPADGHGPARGGSPEPADAENRNSPPDGPGPVADGSQEPADVECRNSPADCPGPAPDGNLKPAEREDARSPAGNDDRNTKLKRTVKGRLLRMLLWTVVTVISLAVLLFAGGWLYLKSARFGALPEGERLARIELSPNWRDGAFRNLEPARDTSRANPRGRFDFFFRGERTAPKEPLPVAVTDLKALKDGEFVWFGHSTFLFVLGGRTFLVDPVFVGGISPIPFA